MTTKQHIKLVMAILPPSAVLSGSGVMAMHGMNRYPEDLDIFVTTYDWFGLYDRSEWKLVTPNAHDVVRHCDPAYLAQDVEGIEVNVFCSWRKRGEGDVDVNTLVSWPEVVDSVRCVPLGELLRWKSELHREKDLPDVSAIAEHLIYCKCLSGEAERLQS